MLSLFLGQRMPSVMQQPSIDVNDRTVTGFSNAGWRIKSDGTVETTADGFPFSYVENWYTPGIPPNPGLYECRATPVEGSSGNTNVWLSLASTRAWNIVTKFSFKRFRFLLEIRLASSGVVLSSADITIQVTGTDGEPGV